MVPLFCRYERIIFCYGRIMKRNYRKRKVADRRYLDSVECHICGAEIARQYDLEGIFLRFTVWYIGALPRAVKEHLKDF